MNHPTTRATNTKAKKSYTLSRQAVAFLEQVRKQRRARSTSAVLEEILQAAQQSEQERTLERATENYYSSLDDSELQEQIGWGNFALAEMTETVSPLDGPRKHSRPRKHSSK